MENQNIKHPDTNFITKTSILRILLSVSEVSGPYNQFTFPFAKKQNITLNLLNEPKLDPINIIFHQKKKSRYISHFLELDEWIKTQINYV